MKPSTPPTIGRREGRDEALSDGSELIPVVVPLLALGPALLMIFIFWAVV